MIKNLVTFGLALAALSSAAAIALIAGNAQAQNSQFGAVENFYHANVDIDNSQYAGHVVNPGYWLIDSNQWSDVDSRWISGGFVRLGVSSWEDNNTLGGGVPLKDLAIAYAKTIGADVVVYTTTASTDKNDWTSHYVTFYARQSVPRATSATSSNKPTNAEVTLAMNLLQDSKHRPHVKAVWYDRATDTYNWIGPKFGRRMSEPSSQLLGELESWLSEVNHEQTHAGWVPDGSDAS